MVITNYHPLSVKRYRSCLLLQKLIKVRSVAYRNSVLSLTFSEELNLFSLSVRQNVGMKKQTEYEEGVVMNLKQWIQGF